MKYYGVELEKIVNELSYCIWREMKIIACGDICFGEKYIVKRK